MDNEHSIRHARKQLEDELREQVLTARKAYRDAADNYMKMPEK
jgi:hypothetical protein